MLPATKTIPKELLPVGDKPTIQYTIEWLASIWVENIVVVTSQWKQALEDYFDKNYELEEALKRKWKMEMLEKINKPKEIANITFTKQMEQLWTSHALRCAQPWIHSDYMVMVFGDNIFDPRTFKQMVDIHRNTWWAVIVLNEIPRDQVHRYWVVELSEDQTKVTGMVEKPAVEDAPSNLIISWMYLLPRSIFTYIEETKVSEKHNEFILTDALEILIEREWIYACKSNYPFLDVGNPQKRYEANKQYFENNWQLFID